MGEVKTVAKIIDGKKLALKYQERLSKRLQGMRRDIKIVSIVVGDDPGSLKYSQIKQNKAKELRIDFVIERLPKSIEFNLVNSEIEKLNEDSKVTGIMVQLPVPDSFSKGHSLEEFLSEIDPKKDVDGLTGGGSVLPATVRGVLSILEAEKVSLPGQKIAVVGSEGMMGKPLVKVLVERGAKVIAVDKKAPSTKLEDIKDAKVLISCTGVKGLIKPEMVKIGAVLIDVGLGDFDPGCFEKASSYTPAQGGVGPMTVISLMENAVDLM